MDRVDFYTLQKVSEAEADQAFDQAEAAIWALLADLGVSGIFTGLVVDPTDPTGISVQVLGGTAYDASGARCAVPSTQVVDLSEDEDAVSTEVAGDGNEKIVSVFLKFDRALSDPRTDGDGNPIKYLQAESFAFVVRQGSEDTAGDALPAALDPDLVLLVDVTRSFEQTEIIVPDLSLARRQDAFVLAGDPYSVRQGLLGDALADILAAVNDLANTPKIRLFDVIDGLDAGAGSSPAEVLGVATYSTTAVKVELFASAPITAGILTLTLYGTTSAGTRTARGTFTLSFLDDGSVRAKHDTMTASFAAHELVEVEITTNGDFDFTGSGDGFLAVALDLELA